MVYSVPVGVAQSPPTGPGPSAEISRSPCCSGGCLGGKQGQIYLRGLHVQGLPNMLLELRNVMA